MGDARPVKALFLLKFPKAPIVFVLKIVQEDSQDSKSTETFVTIYPSSGEIIAEPRTPAENTNTLTFLEQLKRTRGLHARK